VAKQKIDKSYLREFFKLGEGEEAERELVRLSKKLVRLQFENGQDICTIDAEADGFFFLESGSAAVLDRDGTQINLMHPGQYFGEYAVLSQQRRLLRRRWRLQRRQQLGRRFPQQRRQFFPRRQIKPDTAFLSNLLTNTRT
jgi:CRP-like cAMP-binding protein